MSEKRNMLEICREKRDNLIKENEELRKKISSVENKNGQLENALKVINEQNDLGLNFESGTKLARQLRDYEKVKNMNIIANWLPNDHTENYEYYKKIYKQVKKILKSGIKKDMKEMINEYRSYWKGLTLEKTWFKLYLDIMHFFILLYDWAISEKNKDYITVMTPYGHIKSVPRLQCLWIGEKEKERIINWR